MASLNKVSLIGNLCADPELRFTPSGQPVCDLRLATNESWTKDGEKHEKTEFHRLIVWGKLAEVCSKFLTKGRQVYCEGKLQTRSWEKDGDKKYATEIVVSEVQFLGDGKSKSAKADEPDNTDIPY